MVKTMNFKSKEAYRKWRAFGHIRTPTGKIAKYKSQSIFSRSPGHVKVKLRGKPIKVKHSR